MAGSKIRGEQVKDDSLTGADINESTLIIDTLQDADGDTKIGVETAPDEDKIRFKVAAAEIAVLESAGLVLSGTLHVKATDAEAIRIAKGGNDYKQIVFEVDGVDSANIHLSNAENLVIVNEKAGADIQIWTKEWGESLAQVMTIKDDGNVGIGRTNPTSRLSIGGSLAMSVLNINAANDPGTTYTVTSNDCVILVDTRETAQGGIDSAITLTLPDASDNPGMVVTIKDMGGDASSNSISIQPVSPDTFGGLGVGTVAIVHDNKWAKFISDGVSAWAVLDNF